MSDVSQLLHPPGAVTSRLVPTNSSIINAHQVSGQVTQGNHISRRDYRMALWLLAWQCKWVPKSPSWLQKHAVVLGYPQSFGRDMGGGGSELRGGAAGCRRGVTAHGHCGLGTLCTPCSPLECWEPLPMAAPCPSPCPPPPFALSLLLSLHTCSSPSLPFSLSLSSSSPCLSLSLSPSSYLIPLVFLLSACPADLHACCVEAAQLDLMPPAVRSRAGSGLGAALLRAGEGEVGPLLWPLSSLPFPLHPLSLSAHFSIASLLLLLSLPGP